MSDELDDKAETVEARVDRALKGIARLAPAVQIMASWCDSDGCTHSLWKGQGDWNARYGLARRWIERERHRDAVDLDAEAGDE